MLNKIFAAHRTINLNVQFKGHEAGDITEIHNIDRDSVTLDGDLMRYTQDGIKHSAIALSNISNACFYEDPDKQHYLWFNPSMNIAVEYIPRQKEKTYSIR